MYSINKNRTIGISETVPVTGHAADMPKSTQMTYSGHPLIWINPEVCRSVSASGASRERGSRHDQ
jgi:hypothetical protein